MKIKPLSLAILSASALALTQLAVAQESNDIAEEEVTVTGIRAALQNALIEKRESANLIEVIQSEDIGKLPDQNLAEVLENITGIQITRTAGVGTGVQIRGTNSNRVEINGVSTVGSGAGRSGIDFEDVNASIISAVEVTKASEAKTVEGSVGGTVNLKTIRPLELKETLGSIRIQGEQNSLSDNGGWEPRLAGAYGDNWETDAGTFGFVLSGSFTQQEAVSLRPRADADTLFESVNLNPDALAVQGIDAATVNVPAEYLGVQFLLQEQENDDFETINVATTFEWAPNDDLKFHVDYILNDQERSRDQYRLQASGVSNAIDTNVPTGFETVDFGSALFPNGPEDTMTIDGVTTFVPGLVPSDLSSQQLGQFQRAVTGNIIPFLSDDDDDPNLRFTTETGSRVTKSEVFVIGGEWVKDRWTSSFELASTTSDTRSPTLNTTLNFINPNCPLDDGGSNDNCVPFVYDLTGDRLAFDVITDQSITEFAPSDADFLNPENVVLDAVSQSRNTTDNSEDAFRIDFSYDFGESGITSVDFGFRYNESESRFRSVSDSFGFSALEDSPNGLLFEELLIAGPNNFGDGDGRSLFIDDFLLIDPNRSFSDPEGVISILEAALADHRVLNPDADGALTISPEFDPLNSYFVEEETEAFYAQANFEFSIFRGNFGLRYIDTTLDQTSASGVDLATGTNFVESSGNSYDFVLPRLNLVAQVSEDVVLRFGYGSDIRRPDFDDVTTALNFDDSENASLDFGNAQLEPEEVDSFDLGVEWYFAPEAVVSLAYFRKDRTNVFGTFTDAALLTPDANGDLMRETDINCPGGGIFNAEVEPNVLGDPNTTGLCVDRTQPSNDSGETTQEGFELAVQYNLGIFEDTLGWASGFGILANYTTQNFSGGEILDVTSGRGETILGLNAIPRGLLDFSEDAYNFTFYYEKYGLSARARYAWRDDFRTQDFGGGANSSGSSTFSYPVVTEARGQLNLSVNYDISEQLNVGLEVINATESEIVQRCVSDSGPVCFVGLPDRRITAGVSYRF